MVAEGVPLGISIIDSLSSILSDKLNGSIISKSLTSSKLNSLKVEFTKSVNKSSFPFLPSKYRANKSLNLYTS